MRHLAQEDHADLGLIDDDNTEDMTAAPAIPGGDAPSKDRYRPRPIHEVQHG